MPFGEREVGQGEDAPYNLKRRPKEVSAEALRPEGVEGGNQHFGIISSQAIQKS